MTVSSDLFLVYESSSNLLLPFPFPFMPSGTLPSLPFQPFPLPTTAPDVSAFSRCPGTMANSKAHLTYTSWAAQGGGSGSRLG